jgi:hypothetical protein
MHSGFMQFAAFDQDAIDNKAFMAKGKLSMPVLAIGGEKSFGATMATIMKFAASNVREGRHSGLRPLDHGGKPARHHRHGTGLPGRLAAHSGHNRARLCRSTPSIRAGNLRIFVS